MPEQSCLVKNYDKNAWQADRDPHGIFRTPTDYLMLLAAGLIVRLGSPPFSLATAEHALEEMEVTGLWAALASLRQGR